jgi:hypothetical protein
MADEAGNRGLLSSIGSERDQYFAKLQQALEQVGCKMVIFCDSAWSSEQWQAFGVEEYPDIEAVQKLTAIHQEIQHFRFIDSMTFSVPSPSRIVAIGVAVC